MFQVLHTATLLRLLDAPAEAVFQTIETGAWSGCIWPGNQRPRHAAARGLVDPTHPRKRAAL